MTLGERLTRARLAYQTSIQAKKSTVTDFAGRLGIRTTSLHDLESGKSRAPSAETLLRLRDLGINVDYVVRGIGQPLTSLLSPAAAALPAQFSEIYASLDDYHRNLWVALGRLLVDASGANVAPPKDANEVHSLASIFRDSMATPRAYNALTQRGPEDDKNQGAVGGAAGDSPARPRGARRKG